MIKELTPEQEAQIPMYLKLGLDLGTGTDQYDPSEVEALMTKLYLAKGMEPPKKFIHAPSPRAGKKLAEAGVSHFAGSQELYWIVYYKYINEVLPVVKTTEPLDELFDVCSKVGWFWPGIETCVITPKPLECHMVKDKLHCTTGPALRWADGFEVWSLSGIRVSKYKDLILNPDPEAILNVKNVEVRAELIKVAGIEKFFDSLSPKLLDSATFNSCNYELYRVTLVSGMDRVYLKMPNPSIEEIHIEAVPPDVESVEQALAFRNFGTYDIEKGKFIPPTQLT